MSIEEIMQKHINPLIQRGDSITGTLKAATELLDYLSIMETGEEETHVDGSVRFWIGRIAIDALNYVNEVTSDMESKANKIKEVV